MSLDIKRAVINVLSFFLSFFLSFPFLLPQKLSLPFYFIIRFGKNEMMKIQFRDNTSN